MSVLLLPTDGCPSCLMVPVHPYRREADRTGSLWCRYNCPRCGHWWSTWWAPDAADLPCPGCRVCGTSERETVSGR